MKRIYFTAIPLDSNFTIELKSLKPVNFTLNTEIREYAYPIIPVIDATMREEDECKVVVVRQTNSPASPNYDLFRSELGALGLHNLDIVDVTVAENQSTDLLLGLYRKLLTLTENNACYYADMTFGSKTLPIILFSVLTYIDRILIDTDITGIYYQEILRNAGKTRDAYLYEVSSIFSLNSIAYGLSDAPDGEREKLFNLILNPTEELR